MNLRELVKRTQTGNRNFNDPLSSSLRDTTHPFLGAVPQNYGACAETRRIANAAEWPRDCIIPRRRQKPCERPFTF
jgi:hypothetical protein